MATKQRVGADINAIQQSASIGLNPGLTPSWTSRLSNWNITLTKENDGINPALAVVSSTAQPPQYTRVVFNYTTGNIAVVTDELTAKVKSEGDALELAHRYDMQLKFYSEDLQRAFYKVRPGTDIIELKGMMIETGESGVIVDIMEHEFVPY